MKKIYLKQCVEFEEIEESLLYQPSIKSEGTTPENPTDGPTTEEGGEGGDDWWN